MKERILVKLDQLEQMMTELTTVLPSSSRQYAESLVHRRAVERIIQMCVECVLDICAMIVKEKRLGVPNSDDDLFSKLEDRILEPILIEKLRNMRRFRNRIVHRYGNLDENVVYGAAHQLLKDLKTFASSVREFVRNEKQIRE